jgi:hypothetical protein
MIKTRRNFYGLMSCVVAIILSAAFCCAAAASDSLSVKKPLDWRFAPEFHFNEDLRTFFLQKDTTFKKRFFVEWISSAELAFLSVNNRFFLFGEMALTMGLGRWADKPILFDPNLVDAGFGPMAEYRFDPVNISLWLDHHCFHEIDTLVLTPVYWNRLCFSASSPNFRPGPYISALSDPAPITWKNRLAWQASLGYYFHEIFGMDTSIVAWNQDYRVDIICDMRCAVYRWRGFAGVVSAKTGAYLTTARGILWKQEAGAEILATQGRFGLSLFADWVIVDQLQPRLNRDKLLIVGIKGFL